MNIGYKLYEGTENFAQLQVEMALACEANGWCMEDGYDGDRRYLIIKPPYVPSLDELKQAKFVELKSTRDSLEVEPILYNGNLFDYDEKARDRINAAIISLELLGADASFSWTTANNKEAIVTANDLKMVIANVAIRSNELHVKYRELKEQVNNATTVDEVNAIEW